MYKIILPEFGAHLSSRSHYKFNEFLAAPFPKAQTTNDILEIAAHIEKQGYLIVPREQRPVRLRAPKEGENAVVVAETTDQPAGEKPTLIFIAPTNAATGAINSRLWFCRADYPLFGSFKALQDAWREEKERLRTNALIRVGIAKPFERTNS